MADHFLNFPVYSRYYATVILFCFWIIFTPSISSLHVPSSLVGSKPTLTSHLLSQPLLQTTTGPEIQIIAIRNRKGNHTFGHLQHLNPFTTTAVTPLATSTSSVETTLSTAKVLVPSILLRINSTGKPLPATSTPKWGPYHLHLAPSLIGRKCYSEDQCRRIDPISTCNSTQDDKICLCPPGTFVSINRTACIQLPTVIGHYCYHNYHCLHKISNSVCNMNSCNCSDGYFDDSNKTTCHRYPHQLGDFCQDNNHCLKILKWSKCEPDNNTCVCEYGYTQTTAQECKERNILRPFVPLEPPSTADCQGNCVNWTNSRCVTFPGLLDAQCRCDYRHARAYNSDKCVPVQTYEIDIALVQEAGRYDYLPLSFNPEYTRPKVPTYQLFAYRITLSGLMKLFASSSSSLLQDRYVTSEVIRFENLDKTNQSTTKGVKATVLLHLTAYYMNATQLSDISKFFEDTLEKSDGVLADSALKVSTPFRNAVEVRDYNECALAERNDCSNHAMCINSLGSFMCVCNPRYNDVSNSLNLRPGRKCSFLITTEPPSDLCSSDDCKTRWEFVGLAVTLFLLIVMAFITYEIIQRKKTFTARKLYEKFGTTKIRKLRQASMKRLHERKKRMKEENKKKKEEEKQKKEELKREKSEKRKLKEEEKKTKQEEKKQRDLEKDGKNVQKTGRSDDDVEWLGDRSESDVRPPTSVDTMHPPSQPFLVTSEDTSTIDISSLPGTVNTPEIEMGFPRRAVSPIEESPV